MTERQTWLVTGAGRGLGRAIALAALDAGHAVVATVRGEADLPAHDRLDMRRLDVRDRDAAGALVDEIAAAGRIDVLVNNAGVGHIGAVEEATPDEVELVISTNLLGPLWLSRAVVPVMRAQGGGHLVHVSTVGAVGTMPLLGLYNAAKWGLEGMAEALAAEVMAFGIRSTIVEPGGLATDWAGTSMRFARPEPAYDDLRTALFGTAEVPWPAADPGDAGGTDPAEAAAAILAHVAAPDDGRLRLLVGDDAPGQVAAALAARLDDYGRDERFRLRA